MNKKRVILIGFLLILLVAIIVISSFLADDRKLMNEARDSLQSDDEVTVKLGDWIELLPADHEPDRAIIFLQGAKVHADAYVPLLKPFAAQGFLVVIPQAIFSISFFMPEEPTRVINNYEGILSWTLMGHSLGGVVASQYVYRHPGKIDNLVLLASLPADSNSLAGDDIDVLSISAQHDLLVTQDEVEDAKKLLPDTTEYYEIDGGNHAYFGYYGEQEGDGRATISREEQHNITQIVTLNFLNKNLELATTPVTVDTFIDDNLFFEVLFPPRDERVEMSPRQFLILLIINLVFTILPLVVAIQFLRLYRSNVPFRNELRPLLFIAWFMFVARILPVLNRYANLVSAGWRDFIINVVQSNILPFVFIFYALSRSLQIYVKVPQKRKSQFFWTIRLSRLSTIGTGAAVLGFIIVQALTSGEVGASVFTIIAYILFLVITILLFFVYRLLTVEQDQNVSKMIRIKINFLRILTISTLIYLLSAIIITFIVIFNPEGIDLFGGSVFLNVYSCLYTTLGSLLAYWIFNPPVWIKERFGIHVPRRIDELVD